MGRKCRAQGFLHVNELNGAVTPSTDAWRCRLVRSCPINPKKCLVPGIVLGRRALYRLLDLPTRMALWYHSSPRALSPTTTDRGRALHAGLLAIFSFSTR